MENETANSTEDYESSPEYLAYLDAEYEKYLAGLDAMCDIQDSTHHY